MFFTARLYVPVMRPVRIKCKIFSDIVIASFLKSTFIVNVNGPANI